MTRPHSIPSICLSLVAGWCLLSSQPVAGAEKASARTVPKKAPRSTSIVTSDIPVVEIPQSTFVPDIRNRQARDPFFPNAQYAKKPTEPVAPTPVKPLVDDGTLSSLKLTGVGGVGEKRWAMVNGTTLYLGEHARFQIGGRPLEIECVEMDEKTVTVGIKGTNIRRALRLD